MKSDGTLKERFNKEVLKWKELDKKQKWEYYKSYYLGKTIVGVLLFAMFCSLIYEIFINNKEEIIAGSIVNLKISEEGYSLLTDKYLEYTNSGKDKDALLSADTFISFDGSYLKHDNDRYIMALIAQVSVGEFDYLLLDQTAYDGFFDSEIYTDLRICISDKTINSCKELLVYEDYMGEKNVPLAIKLPSEKLNDKLGITNDTVYLVITQLKPDVDKADTFVNYLLNELR